MSVIRSRTLCTSAGLLAVESGMGDGSAITHPRDKEGWEALIPAFALCPVLIGRVVADALETANFSANSRVKFLRILVAVYSRRVQST